MLASLLSASCAVSTISQSEELPSSVSAGDAGSLQDAATIDLELLDAGRGPTVPQSERAAEVPRANGDAGAAAAVQDASVAGAVRVGALPQGTAAASDGGAQRELAPKGDTPRDAAAAQDAKPRDAAAPEQRDAALARDAGATDATMAAPFALTSSALRNGAALPERHRCDGDSPPLAWTAGPRGTLSYALVFRDLSDERDLWLLYDIPAAVHELAAGVPQGSTPSRPLGAHQAENYQGEPRYRGPCDLLGSNDLELTLYAVDVAELPLLLGENASAASVLDRLESHVLARSKLTLTSRN